MGWPARHLEDRLGCKLFLRTVLHEIHDLGFEHADIARCVQKVAERAVRHVPELVGVDRDHPIGTAEEGFPGDVAGHGRLEKHTRARRHVDPPGLNEALEFLERPISRAVVDHQDVIDAERQVVAQIGLDDVRFVADQHDAEYHALTPEYPRWRRGAIPDHPHCRSRRQPRSAKVRFPLCQSALTCRAMVSAATAFQKRRPER